MDTFLHSRRIAWLSASLVPFLPIGILGLLIWTTTQLMALFDAAGVSRARLNVQLCGCLLMALAPVLVAFGYWIISLVVWCVGRHDPVTRKSRVTGQIGAGIMGAGTLADIRPVSTWGLNLLLLWGAPLLLHFYN